MSLVRNFLAATLLLCAVFSVAQQSQEGRLMRFPDIRGNKIVFVYGGDLWLGSSSGGEARRITAHPGRELFPKFSPDGKWMVFLTYDKSVTGHPENKDVMLRLMSLGDSNITVLAKLFGGQGTINVPSWSPDSKQLAFVSYQLIP